MDETFHSSMVCTLATKSRAPATYRGMSVSARHTSVRNQIVSNPSRAPSNSDVYPVVDRDDGLFAEPSGEHLIDQRRDASVLFDVDEHERNAKRLRCRQFALTSNTQQTNHSCMVDLRRLNSRATAPTSASEFQSTRRPSAVSIFDDAPASSKRWTSRLALALGMTLAFSLGLAAWSLL